MFNASILNNFFLPIVALMPFFVTKIEKCSKRLLWLIRKSVNSLLCWQGNLYQNEREVLCIIRKIRKISNFAENLYKRLTKLVHSSSWIFNIKKAERRQITFWREGTVKYWMIWFDKFISLAEADEAETATKISSKKESRHSYRNLARVVSK